MTAFVMRRWDLQPYPFPQAPLHVHDRGDEAFVVLTGLLDVTMDSEVRRLGAGEFAFIEAGTQHTFATVDDTPTSVLVAMTPDVDALIRELHQVPEEEQPLVWPGTTPGCCDVTRQYADCVLADRSFGRPHPEGYSPVAPSMRSRRRSA